MGDIDFVQKSKKDVWQTPPSLWEPVNRRENIDLDPCAGPETQIGDTNYTKHDNGLQRDWFGTVWLNPPFSYKDAWLDVAATQIDSCERLYIVTPDSTNVQSWWHSKLTEMCDYVWFSDGRIQYIDPATGEKGRSPSFGTAVHVSDRPPESVINWMQANGDLLRRDI